MDANHATDDQSSTNPLVTLPETAEVAANIPAHSNGVIVEDETQEPEKESGAETKTADGQSDNQNSISSDDDSDYSSAETDKEQSSDVGSDHTVLAAREEEQSFGEDAEGSDVDSDHTIPAVRDEEQGFGVESESSEVDSDRTVPAVRDEEYSSDEDYDDNSDYSEDYESHYPFQRFYTCRPINGKSREHLEQGNLVIMPESALEVLYRTRPSYPMLFEIRNDSKERVSHCGVAEFTSEEGTVMVPRWMMENLKVEAGETLLLKSTILDKGTFAKIQPHSAAFFATRDVKTVLEQTLSAKFSCLTTGDTIAIDVGSKKFYINIVETKPDDAICIIDTDCTVDFAVPLDYKEPAPAPAPQELREERVGGSRGFIPFTGAVRRLNETSVAAAAVEEMQSVVAEPQKVQVRPVATAAEAENKQFQPFTGRKYTLGG